MSQKVTLSSIRDTSDNPVLGLTGTNIKFYYAPAGTIEVTGLTVAEKGYGAYEVDGFPDDKSIYVLLKINGTFAPWYGYRREGGLKALEYMEGVTENLVTTFNKKLNIDGTNTPSADIDWDGNGITSLRDPVSDQEPVTLFYLRTNYGLGSGTAIRINTNVLIVDANQGTEVTGKIYKTVQGAITYASSQTPSSTSWWTILVFSNKTEDGYTENITYIRYIKIVGIDNAKIKGSLTPTTGQTWTGYDTIMKNLIFKDTDKDYHLKGVRGQNLFLLSNGASGEVNLKLDSSELFNCHFQAQNSVNIESLNSVGSKPNRIINCTGNSAITWLSTDLIYGYDYVSGDVIEL